MAKEKMSGSPRFSFNTDDLMEVLKQALLVGLAAILTFVVDNLGNIEMGETVLLVLPMVTMGLNSAIRWVQDYTNSSESGDDETAEFEAVNGE